MKLRDKFEFNFDWHYRNNFSESVRFDEERS